MSQIRLVRGKLKPKREVIKMKEIVLVCKRGLKQVARQGYLCGSRSSRNLKNMKLLKGFLALSGFIKKSEIGDINMTNI